MSSDISMDEASIVKLLLHAGAHSAPCLLSTAICHDYYGEDTYCPASYRNIGRSYYERHGSRGQYCDMIQMLLDAGANPTHEPFGPFQKMLQVVLRGSNVLMESLIDPTICLERI
jgi:hypothetical protein